jgi:hypothetical protein
MICASPLSRFANLPLASSPKRDPHAGSQEICSNLGEEWLLHTFGEAGWYMLSHDAKLWACRKKKLSSSLWTVSVKPSASNRFSMICRS